MAERLKAEDFTPTSPLTPNVVSAPKPGPNEVLVHGSEDDIERLSRGIKALNAEVERKARRKRQRAARKRNR